MSDINESLIQAETWAKVNNKYLIFINPEDAQLIQDAFDEMFSYGPSDADSEYEACLKRFQEQIKENE